MTQPNPQPNAIPGLITPQGMTPATYSNPGDGNAISGAVPPGAATAPPVPASAPDTGVTGDQIVTIPPPATPTPPPAATPPPANPADHERGYPADTPLEQMTAEQREAYWRYHSRKWEGMAKGRSDYDELKAKAAELEQLKASTATDHEKAIAAARAAGAAEASAKAAVVLVDAHVRANLISRLTPDRVDALAAHLDHRHFLGADGFSVDGDKVAAFVNAVAPIAQAGNAVTVVPTQPTTTVNGTPATLQFAPAAAATTAPSAASLQPGTGLPRALPDLGQGTTSPAKPSGLAAGAEMAKQMFGDRTQRP